MSYVFKKQWLQATYKCWNTIELIFQKELMLIKRVYQRIFHYWYFKDIGFKFEPYLCNECHDLTQKAMTFIDVAIIYVKQSADRIHFWYMSKDDAISIMNNSNLIDKRGVL